MPAVSQAQQRLMGQAYALKKGDLKPEDLNPEYREQIEDLAKGMTLDQLKDYAETSHEKLPKKVREMKTYIPTFESFVNETNEDISLNEAGDLAYWKQYEVDNSKESEGWENDKVKTISTVVSLIDKCITAWNKNASKEGTDRVSKPSEKHIGDLAIQFFKKFGYVNGAIIQAMIAQES
jgi:hypothetical protein